MIIFGYVVFVFFCKKRANKKRSCVKVLFSVSLILHL